MILILGSGRSGTTFLAKLFDSHPKVLYRHEPDSILSDESIPFQPHIDDLNRYKDQAGIYLNRLATLRAPKVSLHLPLFPKEYRTAPRQILHNTLGVVSKALAKINGAERLIQVPDLINPNANDLAIVIKSVNSLNRARLFLNALPDVRIIHIIRHPCGVVASRIRGAAQGLMKPTTFFNSLYRMENAFKYNIPPEDLEKRTFEEQTAFHWMVTNDAVLSDMIGQHRYRLVRYEDLCLETTSVINELFSFCGLVDSPQTEAFVRRLEEQESKAAGYFSVMRSPQKAVFQWQEELTNEQIERINSIVQSSEIGSYYQNLV